MNHYKIYRRGCYIFTVQAKSEADARYMAVEKFGESEQDYTARIEYRPNVGKKAQVHQYREYCKHHKLSVPNDPGPVWKDVLAVLAAIAVLWGSICLLAWSVDQDNAAREKIEKTRLDNSK
jgi:hypothetical protein